MKYHPWASGLLTARRVPAPGPRQAVSLTGAVSSQRITEEFEGRLTAFGKRGRERKGRSRPHCETDGSGSRESGT